MSADEIVEIALCRQMVARGDLRDRRVKLQLSQSELAEAIDVSQATMTRYEALARLPGRDVSLRLWRFLARAEEAVAPDA